MSIRAVSSGPERVRLMEEEESRASEDSPSESLLAAVRLAMIPGVGPKTRQTLLSEFGTADAVLDAPSWRLTSVDGVGRTLSERIASANERIDALAEIDLCRQHGVTILRHGQEGYPRLLSEIHDPPGVLFVLGGIEPRDDLALSIVGSRHCTNYGRSQAKRLAAELSRMGFTIVSGLARGIDAAAHQGAMDAGGRTIAVLGSGVLNIYPPDHARLAEDVTANGALISESPPDASRSAARFLNATA